MEKNKSNWWIDLILFGLFWIAFFPDLTGLRLHEWLGAAAILLALFHLIVHWKWVETVTLRFFSRTAPQARVYYLFDWGMALGFMMILLTGLLISTWLNLPLSDLAAWTEIHLIVSVFTLLLVVAKLVLHWRWVAAAARRYVFDPVFSGGLPAERTRAANPVDRRDFLKLTGVLGAAAVVTIHGLFDDTREVQAETILPNLPETENLQPISTEDSSIPVSDSAGVSPAATAEAIQSAPTSEPTAVEPTAACTILCPNGCSYPGRCRRYVDLNDNGRCDNGECL